MGQGSRGLPQPPDLFRQPSRLHEPAATSPQATAPHKKVGRPLGSRNQTQTVPTQILTRLTRATSERAQHDQSIPATQQLPASTADSTATGNVATQRS
ncbi:hypothetical protein E4U57_005700 [Claviceps arundinis]|uniref:Uncharacterized protein n=1 Tax=Claviceps arundinis TaxID=1623583 RepID=A0ABQ7P4Y9_9HYPO|nr:hypothetical protein E4U57_005700 [Claviceps arundinis]